MQNFQDILRDSMEMLVEGTALSMRTLLRHGPQGHLGPMNHWTGRYAWSENYEPMDVGYLLGRLWLLHLHTRRPEFREWALVLLERLVPALTERPLTSRPSGVDIYYGLCWGADITGSETLRMAAFQATDRLIAGLWNAEAGLFYSSAGGRNTNIDSLLALLSLPWCARRDGRYLEYFVRHTDTILSLGLLRADGSTFQAAYFDDPERGSKPKDSCAAAIATLALIRLSRAIPELAATYRPVIEGTIRELDRYYLTVGGLLLHGSWGNAAGRWGRPLRFPQEDIMPYANYYFVEALYRSLTEDWRFFRLNQSGGA